MPQTLEGMQTWDLVEYLGQLNPDFTFDEIMTLAETRKYDLRVVEQLYPSARSGMFEGIRELEKENGS